MKLTIITSCSRPENLPALFASIQFEHIVKWIIIYDTTNDQTYTWQYKSNPKILEAECPYPGVLGNAQKNFALKFVKEGSVYYLDDDTVMHPNFWSIFHMLEEDVVYIWDQLSYLYLSKEVYPIMSELEHDVSLQKRSDIPRYDKGLPIHEFYVYTGAFLVPYNCITTEFVPFLYYSSALFLKTIALEHSSKIFYISEVVSFMKALS